MRAFVLLLAALPLLAQPFIRVSPRDPRYFEITDGRPYIPIGLNLVEPRGGDLDTYRDWLDKLAANHGNYVRLWIGHRFFEVEHEKYAVYDPAKADIIRQALDLCRSRGIRVKLTLEHFRNVKPGANTWALKTLYHTSRGGPSEDIAAWVASPEARAQFVRKIQWYRAQFGDDPTVFAWELWNEMDAIQGGDYMDWTRAMLPELHKAFPKNLALQSLGSYDRESKRARYREHSLIDSNDAAQVHRYLDLGAQWDICHGPVDLLAAEAVRDLIAFNPGKPVLLAESGAVEPNHSGPFTLYATDKAGILLHDILFAPFFAGAAGPGQIWHWGEYVDRNNLWFHFARFAEVVKDIDPPAEHFEASTIPHPRLRIYVLKGSKTTLVWLRDSQNTWMSELRDQRPPESIKGLATPLRLRNARVYDPWQNRWTKAGSKLPPFSRSLVLRAMSR